MSTPFREVRALLKSASHSGLVIGICLLGFMLETFIELPFRIVMFVGSRRRE
jgi:hypothetical protein